VAIGPPRIDAIACILSLAGYLPRPERLEDFKDAEPAVRDAMTRDLTPMVRLADRVELEPGITLESTRETRPVIAWKIAMVNPRPEWLAYSMGVRFLLGQTGQPFAFVMLAQHAAETGIAAATEVMVVEYVSDVVAVVDSIVWDFALWHPDLAPVIVVYNAKEGRAVVNCSRGSMTATDFFGDGGLRTVLWEVGWEGREEAGGSPLDARLSREEILDAARKIASRAKKN
jgi:hypothetical protein